MAATDYPLYSCLFVPGGGLPSAAAAALPFLTALACDPDNGARVTLIERGTHDTWREEWRRQGDKVTALLAGPASSVRRTALLLADDDALLERWHAETDPAVSLTLLPPIARRRAAPRVQHL
ncbi:hypothetical protein ACIRUL_15385 [Streptomyces sp. NPDC101171]|uniref:hypothetical protein n=1 Tax=Streptomyces sp. NPDC101171 TaxID=3366122 RepID=UPI003819A5F3